MEMREKLMEVIFDNNGNLRLERIESLLQVISQDAVTPGAELIPVAGAGLKLLLGPDGSTLRSRLLMTLIKDERLSASDIKALISLLRRTFSPRKVANGMLQNLNPRTT